MSDPADPRVSTTRSPSSKWHRITLMRADPIERVGIVDVLAPNRDAAIEYLSKHDIDTLDKAKQEAHRGRVRVLEAGAAPDPIDPATGQHGSYWVLSEEERAKGFIAPVRRSYVHVGRRPKHPTRPLTAEERAEWGDDFECFEQYPESERPKTGRFWKKSELTSGCGASTRMSQAIAETYARDPRFYGSTFCVHCGTHLPVSEFVWEGTDIVVGSMPPEPEPQVEPDTELKCCEVDNDTACNAGAEYLIRWGPAPDQYTHACEQHLGKLVTQFAMTDLVRECTVVRIS